jgi:hypothetical protein
MALQKQVITLDFGFGGIDQRTDPKYIQRVRFADLANVRFNKVGRIDRRPGNTASITAEIAATSATQVTVVALSDTVSQMAAYGSNLFAITQTDPPKPYRATSGDGYVNNLITNGGSSLTTYMPVSEMRAAEFGSSVVFTDNGQAISSWDRVESTNHAAFAYNSGGSSAIRIEIREKASNSVVRLLSQVGYVPQLLSHPDGRDQWIVGYSTVNPAVTTKLQFSFYTFGLTTSLTTVTGMPSITDVYASALNMVAVSDTTQSLSSMVCIGWLEQSTRDMKLRRATWPATDGSGAALSTTTPYSAGGGVALALCETHDRTNAGDFRAIWHANGVSGTGVYTATFNRSLTVVLSRAALSGDTRVPIRLVGCQLSSGAAHAMVNYSSTTAGAFVYGYEINTSNTATQIWLQQQMTIHSKALAKPSTSVPYVWMSHYPSTSYTAQNTLFLAASITVSNSGNPPPTMGRLFHTTAWNYIGDYSPTPHLNYDGSSFVAMSPKFASAGLAASATDTRWAFHELRFKTHGTNGWLSAPNRSEMLMTGGIMSAVNPTDGVIPAGPQLFPIISLSATTSGGSMAVGSYAVSGFFEYLDGTGRVSKSAPALPQTFALTGSQVGLIVTVNNYPLGDGIGTSGGALRFVPTRTLVNESQVYYRAGLLSSLNPANYSSSVNLTLADASIAAEEPMYTTGGVIENWQPSAPIAIATNGRRMIAVPGDRPCFVMESKPIVDGSAVSFMEEVGRSILPGGDRIYALAGYLDRWFAFKSNAIFVASGDGADATGQNDNLSDFELMETGLGCTEPRSVVTTPAGVVFHSARGFYIIGSDMGARYIGAAVEDVFAGLTVVGADYDEKNEIVYFSMSNGATAVLSLFNTEQGYDLRFSRDSACGGAVAVIDGVRYCSPSTGIYAQSSTSYIDAQWSATNIQNVRFTTAWTPMGSIQGFGRVYKALVTGTYSSTQASSTVTISIGYDYSATYSETHTIDSATLNRNGESVQFEIRPQRTRCEAMRFDILDQGPVSVTAGSHAPGLAISQIQLEVGVKAPSNKLPASAKARKA